MTKKLKINNLTVYEQGEGSKTVILIHGYGASGRDLLSLSGWLGGGIRYLCPEGPLELEQFYHDAHAWFSIDLETLDCNLEELQKSARQLVLMIEEMQLDPRQTIIAGFSQGAMMALEVALTMREPFLGLGLFSTTLVDKESLLQRATEKKLSFFQSHGHHDSLLPFARAEALFKILTAAGWLGTFHEFEGEHEIQDGVITAFKDFIHALFL